MSDKALKSITLKLATADEIRQLSNGEVKVDATFDDSGAPVAGGLFDRDIFGSDGKKFGRIELVYPVVHPWYEDVVRALTGMDDVSDGRAVLEALKATGNRQQAMEGKGGDSEIATQRTAATQHTAASQGTTATQSTTAAQQEVAAYICAMKKSGVPAEALVLQAVPVVPPVLRPLMQTSEGTVLSSDLNELYQRLVARNNALADMLSKGSDKVPGVYMRDARERLTSAVRALIGRSGGRGSLQGLTDLLIDENGFLKRNLAGKRVDYSGRSVIVSGPDLKIDQCGLPREMALALMRPIIARQMVTNGSASSPGEALDKTISEPDSDDVRKALEQVAATHTVLLNRAPTLHRLGIQPFKPVLVDHKSIALHPLTCYAFNADFDGDQMAVHVPLSNCAERECEELLDSAVNLVSPANGTPITGPVQDISLGLWYLTADPAEGKVKEYASAEELILALRAGDIHPHAPVILKDKAFSGVDAIQTTAGRVLFNVNLPVELRFVNEQLSRGRQQELVAKCLAECGRARARQMLDDLNTLGFEWATLYAPSYGLGTITPPSLVESIRTEALEKERVAREKRDKGEIDQQAFEDEIWNIWSEAESAAQDEVERYLKAQQNGFNPIYAMISSGARGKRSNYGSSFGVLGLPWTDAPKGGPSYEGGFASCFWGGLSPLEHFGRTYGARRGLTDTFTRSFSAWSLMVNLIYAAQGILITAEDCGTSEGIEVTPIEFEGQVLEGIADRVKGRVAAADVKDSKGKMLVKAGELISNETAPAIEAAGISSIKIRSAITCAQANGICAKCYGEDPSYGRMASLGTAVGVIAAQSTTEPATQLTYRTSYPPARAPLPGSPHHPGGLKQMEELFEGKRPELSPTELVEATQRILRYQGVDVNDKHFEILARRMYSFTRIEDPGDTCFAPGQVVDNEVLKRENSRAESAGERPAKGSPAMLGAAAAAANSASVIGSAAVGDSKHILALAALSGAKDNLEGALERIVAGLAPSIGA